MAYIQTLLSYDTSIKETRLKLEGYAHDTAGKFDDFVTNTAKKMNPGHEKRMAWAKNGTIRVLFQPLIPVFQVAKFLIPHLGMKLRLLPASSEFVINSPTINNYSIKIQSAKFHVARIQVIPDLTMALEKALVSCNARYSLTNTTVRVHNIAPGSTVVNLHNIYSGSLPRKAVFALMTDAAAAGTSVLNPWNLAHHNLTQVGRHASLGF